MITVKIEKENGYYKSVSVLGHAMYDDYGKDIVCSAVSSIVITTVNAILSLDKESISYMVSKKGLNIKILKQKRVTNVLIHNMIRMLKELEKKYQENIKIL
ncbi:MAG TPA: ribosomal-processing cysteine protease Prp [Candidatus Onthousia faecigallinarum]|nr:ribosomal-processing cysteine protease Prp [Candidatus Onthousia faecigallinarum]